MSFGEGSSSEASMLLVVLYCPISARRRVTSSAPALIAVLSLYVSPTYLSGRRIEISASRNTFVHVNSLTLLSIQYNST